MKKYKYKYKLLFTIICLVTIALSVFTGCSAEKRTIQSSISSGIKVSYIDVGQGDSVLIEQGNNVMLIDAGKNNSAEIVVNYIKSRGINKIDYIIGTHPHEDHIGGLDKVIDNFDIGKVYMPKVTINTKTFIDVVTSMKNKGIKASIPVPGDKFKLGEAECTILAPNNEKYDNINNYSIVLKIQYGKKSFLFTGDAEAESEREMIGKGYDLKADFLKVGHHGSHSSTSKEFLDRVKPEIAIISLGKNNDYGHPHIETIQKLSGKGIKIFRTDESGTIIINANGNDKVDIKKTKFTTVSSNYSNSKGSIEIKNSSMPNSKKPSNEKQYVDSSGRGLIKGNINKKGEKIYHMPGGQFYNKVKPEICFKTVKEAEMAGFRAVKK